MDRNQKLLRWLRAQIGVALRKESVDRNVVALAISGQAAVALRKESVDRNYRQLAQQLRRIRRSPQGERG